ncbi:MAG: response regulator transcription factor [Vicinamibacteria bacterium]|nr:response regulator transcription factor [Vicinamibacteria bacterium]
MAEKILIIDDDLRLTAMLLEYLAARGVGAEARSDVSTGLAALRTGGHDALILDVMLPDGDGFDVLRRVRAESRIPVIMLTARGEPADRIVGLEIGADDYLPKPFDPRELLARLRAVLRRRTGESLRPRGVLRFGDIEIDPESRVVRRDGEACDLTGYQFDILHVLARNAGRALSRDAIMESVKGSSIEAFDRSIDVHVSRIRAAVEDDPKHPRRILTLRGVGYMFSRGGEGERRR